MYKIRYTLSDTSRKYLCSRKNRRVSHLYYTFDNGWDSVFLLSNKRDSGILLQNKCYYEKQDRDEYNAFRVSIGSRSVLEKSRMHFRVNPDKTLTFVSREPLPWQCMPIHETIRSVDLFRDHVYWKYQNHTWDVATDVAIRISFPSHKILVVLCDCVGETLKTYVDYQKSENSILSHMWSKKVWGMKCENADRFSREMIPLF